MGERERGREGERERGREGGEERAGVRWKNRKGKQKAEGGKGREKEGEGDKIIASVLHTSVSSAHLDNEEHVRAWVGDVENGRPRERSHGPLLDVVIQHVSDLTGVAVEVKRFGYFLLFLRIVQSHDRKYWLNVEIEPAERGRKVGRREGGREGGRKE